MINFVSEHSASSNASSLLGLAVVAEGALAFGSGSNGGENMPSSINQSKEITGVPTAMHNFPQALAAFTKEAKHEEVRLPDDYEPCPRTVVIKQGKRTPNHPGNQCLRAIVLDFVPEYSRTSSKKERSDVVTAIIDTHFKNGGGPFVCWKKKESAWFKACDMQIREKVGGLLRDNLHDRYKSSARFKHVKRKEREAKQKELLQKFKEEANPEQLQALKDPEVRRNLLDNLMEEANQNHPPSPRGPMPLPQYQAIPGPAITYHNKPQYALGDIAYTNPGLGVEESRLVQMLRNTAPATGELQSDQQQQNDGPMGKVSASPSPSHPMLVIPKGTTSLAKEHGRSIKATTTKINNEPATKANNTIAKPAFSCSKNTKISPSSYLKPFDMKDEYGEESSNDELYFMGRCAKRRRILPPNGSPSSSLQFIGGGGLGRSDNENDGFGLGLLRRPPAMKTLHCPGDDVWRLRDVPPASSTPFTCAGDDRWRIRQNQFQQQESFQSFQQKQKSKKQQGSDQQQQEQPPREEVHTSVAASNSPLEQCGVSSTADATTPMTYVKSMEVETTDKISKDFPPPCSAISPPQTQSSFQSQSDIGLLQSPKVTDKASPFGGTERPVDVDSTSSDPRSHGGPASKANSNDNNSEIRNIAEQILCLSSSW